MTKASSVSFADRHIRRCSTWWLVSLWAMIPVLVGIAMYFDVGAALVAGLAVASVAGPTLLHVTRAPARLTAIAVAIAAMGIVGVLIHAGRGMIEMHFGVFIVLALLSVYGFWPAVLAGTVTIAVHHLAVFFVAPRSVFNYDAHLGIVILHATFVIIETVPVALLARKIGHMVEAQRLSLEQLGAVAGQIESSVAKMSTSNQTLADGATQQAAGVEETSSAMTEIASLTDRNAEMAQSAASLAAGSRTAAGRANGAMSRMSTAINEIESSAAETAKIVRAIDEIAFQTNLLALNAAVEAARAGEAGKGFAVVAEEVRTLAMRSAEAARNTSGLIEQSVARARGGVSIAHEVESSLGEITSATEKVAQMVSEIASVSREQATAVTQVNASVAQISEVTQRTAASATETAGVSEELLSESRRLNDLISQLNALAGGSAASTVLN
jgi:methyl-accepting chemotaxis protein